MYASYLDALTKLQASVGTLRAFNEAVRHSEQLRLLRSTARAELQSVYKVVQTEFGLPNIPVYLPVRKKTRVRGLAFAHVGTPTEIRVYPIHGPQHKDHASWSLRDLKLDSVPEVMETLIHESAHVLEGHRHGMMGHDRAFVSAYNDVESAVVAAGICSRVDKSIRLSGCPANSFAGMLFRQCA